MDYKILEARIEFKESKIQRITVLVDCTGDILAPLSDVRAMYATNKTIAGYMFLMPGVKVSEELLQEVAGVGMETVDRDKIFPDWKKKCQST